MMQLKIMNEYQSYRNQLGKKYPKYKEALESGKTYGVVNSFLNLDGFFSPEQMKALIPQDHCYISFSVAKKDETSNTPANEILACVVDDNGNVKSFSIAADDNFFDNCNVYRELLAFPKVEDTGQDEELEDVKNELSVWLGEKLLEPLADYISSKKIWIISPDGDELNNLPFETLHFKGNLVIESKNICYVPSLTVLKLMKEAGEKNNQLTTRKELFAMGNADYGNFSKSQMDESFKVFSEARSTPDNYADLSDIKWINLPGTSKELEKVSACFAENSQKVMTGREASEGNLNQLDSVGELGQYKRILFAAHGLFLPETPELNSIVLTQNIIDANHDGYVTVGELMGYDLNSDLVCLSACKSGLGDYRAGEGIIGLPYALTVAGNKDTIMSIWNVDDTATAEFVATVFKKLSMGKSELQALNETKREFLSSSDKKLSDTSVWAAFLLYGI